MANLINGLGGVAGFGENSLGRNDDSSTGFIDITSVFESGLNFFGTNYTGFYINNNGNITFGSGISTFIPFALNGNTVLPIIAPFFADIDTRNVAVTASPGGTSTGSNLLYYDLDPIGNAVTVTWDDVGEFPSGPVPNAFQLRLTDTGNGNFSIEFRYEDIQWGGSRARAGYSSGDGIGFFELPGSGTDAVLNLETLSNIDDPGVYKFAIESATILGGSGNDTLFGGTGGDNYGIYNSTTVIIENAGEGNDTVWTEVNYVLPANVENMFLVGSISGTGNEGNNIIYGYGVGNNIIYGGNGHDSLYGGEGNDYLDGGTGNDILVGDSVGLDTFVGGVGDDIYGVYNSDTIIIENAGEGNDNVWTQVNYTLVTNLETLYLVGNANGTGNTGDNTIIGYGVGDNVIDGGDGIDNLFGGAGNDTFVLSKTNADNIRDFGLGDDKLQISASSFGGGLVAGIALQDIQIRVGANTADTVEQRFIYNNLNGDLFFDADGSGNDSLAIKIANLNSATLVTSNFLIS